jgi:hypothetical protein
LEKDFTLQKKIPVYILLLVLFLGLWVVVLYGAFIRHILEGNNNFPALQTPALKVAEFPKNVKNLFNGFLSPPAFLGDRFPELDGFKKSRGVPEGVMADEGYLLLSSFNNKSERTLELIRISDQQILYRWNMNVSELLATIPIKAKGSESIAIAPGRNVNYLRYEHPILLEDGSLVFILSDSGFYKIGLCSEVKWLLDRDLHHSIELDSEGNFWVPSHLNSSANSKLGVNFIDDAITKISQSGDVLFVKSVVDILIENGYRGLLLIDLEDDPIHLNDIQSALKTTEFWQKGDLLLSIRNLNTVLLYRPSTDKVIWLKTGPWLGQHDVEFVGESSITVFGNNVFDVPPLTQPNELVHRDNAQILLDGQNIIYRYDFRNNSLTMPYTSAMRARDVRTFSEGRAKVLEDGDVFIEETNFGRLLRLTPETVKWEFVRRIDKNYVGLLNWTRYLTAEQVQFVLPKLQNASCNN